MIPGIHLEVLLAAGYAVFLAAVAAGLEIVARTSRRRTQQFQLAGFRYHREHDVWECPTGQRLGRSETDHELRLARYRAPAHVCNCCRAKPDCTDSDEGRIVEHALDSWFQSEIQKFHRGISIALIVLAALILVIEILYSHQIYDQLLLAGFLGPIGIFGIKLGAGFWNSEK